MWEQRHYRLHRAMDQALLLRGSREFAAVDEYRAFLGKLFDQLNSGRKARLAEEMDQLRPLPGRRLDTVKRVRSRVNTGSLIVVDRNSYSVNSRFIGEIVESAGVRRSPGGLVRRPEDGSAASSAWTYELPHRLPAHHRLAGAQAWRLRRLSLSRAPVPEQPFPHGVRPVADDDARSLRPTLSTDPGACRESREKRRWRMLSGFCSEASAASRRSRIRRCSNSF